MGGSRCIRLVNILGMKNNAHCDIPCDIEKRFPIADCPRNVLGLVSDLMRAMSIYISMLMAANYTRRADSISPASR